MQRNVHTTFLRLLFFHFSHASVIFFIVFMLINRSWTVNRKFDQGLASFFDDTNARSDWDFQFLADNGVQDNPRKPVKILFRRGDGSTMIPFWQVTMTFLLLQKQGGAQFKTNVEKSWAVKITPKRVKGTHTRLGETLGRIPGGLITHVCRHTHTRVSALLHSPHLNNVLPLKIRMPSSHRRYDCNTIKGYSPKHAHQINLGLTKAGHVWKWIKRLLLSLFWLPAGILLG